MEKVIYLDNNSTTKIDKRVLRVMLPYLKDYYGNASSSHFFGKQVNEKVKIARQQVASLVNAQEKEIVFTSGATESINLALKGLINSVGPTAHIITFQTEHKAVLDTCTYLEKIGVKLTYLPVRCDGTIDLLELENSISVDTIAICAMLVNNETGVISDINAIGEIAKKNDIYLLCDATQAAGKINIDVEASGIDLMAFSAHKFYGPKGVGALYINRALSNKTHFTAIQHGGGHENGFRSGTLNAVGIIGFGEACSIASQEMYENQLKVGQLKECLHNLLQKNSGYSVHGNFEHTLFNTLNFHLPNFDANIFIATNPKLAVSNGSACSALTMETSHVLAAMGINPKDSYGSLRISIGKDNTKNDMHSIIKIINNFRKLAS